MPIRYAECRTVAWRDDAVDPGPVHLSKVIGDACACCACVLD